MISVHEKVIKMCQWAFLVACQDASVSLPAEMRKPLLMRDLQFLLLYALMGTKAPVEPSRWCKFQQWAKLTKVVVMVTEGLGLNDYQRWSTQDQKFANTFQAFQQKLQFVSPSSYNSTVAEDLCILPLSCKEIANAKRLYGRFKHQTFFSSFAWWKKLRV